MDAPQGHFIRLESKAYRYLPRTEAQRILREADALAKNLHCNSTVENTHQEPHQWPDAA